MLYKDQISGFTDEASESFDDQLKLAQKLGMEQICIRGVNGKNIGDFTLEEFQATILPILESYQIGLSSIGSPIGKLAWDDSAGFKLQCECLADLCQMAKLANCDYIRIFSFFVETSLIDEKVTQTVVEKLQAFVEIAEKFEVVLLHENEKGIFGDNASRCLFILEAVDSPYFRGIFDFANFVQVKQKPEEAYQLLKNWIDYFHIKDAEWSSGKNVGCGTGDGQIALIMDKAAVAGYQGYLTLEPHLQSFVGLSSLGENELQHVATQKGTSQELFVGNYQALVNLLEIKER